MAESVGPRLMGCLGPVPRSPRLDESPHLAYSSAGTQDWCPSLLFGMMGRAGSEQGVSLEGHCGEKALL